MNKLKLLPLSNIILSVKLIIRSFFLISTLIFLSPTDGLAKSYPFAGSTSPLHWTDNFSGVDFIRMAAKITDDAMAHARQNLTPGITEKDLESIIHAYISEHGYGLSFPIISVNSGVPFVIVPVLSNIMYSTFLFSLDIYW